MASAMGIRVPVSQRVMRNLKGMYDRNESGH